MHDHHQVGRALVDGHADVAHVERQPGLRDGDPVLHLDLRDIEVCADVEADGNREPAVAGRVRRHVDHVLDTVDLLFDWRHHSGGNDIGARAGVLARYGDGRRGDLRVLRDGQAEKGHAAQDHKDDRDDRGKDRSVNEEVRDAHGPSRRYLAACGVPPGPGGLAPCSSGFTFVPGRACMRPLMTMRSSGPIPSLMARRPSLVTWPSVTYFSRAVSWSSMTTTKRRACSVPIATSGTSSAS